MIKIKQVSEKDLSTLASLYSIIYLDIQMGETWNYSSALTYIEYFYLYQTDLFLCAYDDEIPIGAIMSTIKPYYDGIHITETELFVSEDYRGKNIGKELLKKHFELAIAKYDATHIDAHTYINHPSSPLEWYKKIGLKVDNNMIILTGNLEECLKNIE